jgi:hypothetical protein
VREKHGPAEGGRETSRDTEKGSKRRGLTSWRAERKGKVRTQNNSEQVMGTYFLESTRDESRVRTRKEKESDPARDTYNLESAERCGKSVHRNKDRNIRSYTKRIQGVENNEARID